ncbi:YueH family protein [Bacillus altitudinis]
MEWSICMGYEEEKRQVEEAVEESLKKRVEIEEGGEVGEKIVEWVREM